MTEPSPDAAVFVISVAAELTGLHPQTLRSYERLGLVTPGRTGGGGRRYSARDIQRLRTIAELTAAGTGLEGVRRILELENKVAALEARNAELQDELERAVAAHQALVAQVRAARRTPSPDAAPNKLPVLRGPGGSSVVVWRRGQGR